MKYGLTITCYPPARKDTTFVIPEDVELIDYSAFYGAEFLNTIVIPSNVKLIGYMAFGHCCGLKTVVVSEGVNSIEGSAFYNCTLLESITLPDSVSHIGDSVLQGCNNLKEICCNGTSYACEWATANGYGSLINTGDNITDGPWTASRIDDTKCSIVEYTGNASKFFRIESQ